jgi:hypothetical protein
MPLYRVLLVSLTFPMLTLALAAQSTRAPGTLAPVPLLGAPAVLGDARAHLPGLPNLPLTAKPQRSPEAAFDPTRLPALSRRSMQRLRNSAAAPVQIAEVLNRLRQMTQSQAGPQSRCYAIRDYRFEHQDSTSDSMKFKESSTCAAAGNFQTKNAVVSRPVTAR